MLLWLVIDMVVMCKLGYFWSSVGTKCKGFCSEIDKHSMIIDSFLSFQQSYIGLSIDKPLRVCITEGVSHLVVYCP